MGDSDTGLSTASASI